MASLLKFLGQVADAIIPGDQSSWHQNTPAPRPTPQAPLVGLINRATGFNNTPQAPTQAPTRQAPPPLYQAPRTNPMIPQINQATGFNNTPVRMPAPVQRNQVQVPQVNQPLEMTKQYYQGVATDLGHMAQGIARIPETVVRSVAQPGASAIDPNANTSQTDQNTGLRKVLYGSAPVKTYFDQGKDIGQQLHQINNKIDPKTGILLAPVLGALDLAGGGKGSMVKDLAKASTEKAVVETAAKHGVEVSVKGAVQLAKTIKPNEIKAILNTESKPLVSTGTKPSVTMKTPSITQLPVTPAKNGLQVRGFSKNITKTLGDNQTAQQVAESIPGYKPITNKSTLKQAANEIMDNPSAVYAEITTKAQLTSANDVVKGNLLLRQAIEDGNIEDAIVIGNKLGMDGTKLGQAVQAYATFKKTTPEGIVTYASKQAGKTGKNLDPQAAQELITAAKRIAAMPEGFERATAVRALLGKADSLGRGYKDLANEIFNVPRAAMATADFSAPLRQGAILGSRFPGKFGKAFTESAKYMFKPEYYKREMYAITQRPTYSLMKSRKLAVDAADKLTGTEEQFLGSILEGNIAKRLGFGHVVAGSDRAYSGFLTRFRADVFDKILVDTQKAGVKLDNRQLDSLTKFINSASGRGQGNVTDQVSRLQVFFSARLWKSRLDTLNPVYYARLDPTARKYALQTAASFAGITTTILGLAKASGADVNTDPRSADFGKIKVGNTRYDILGGLQQNIRLAAQLATGEKINSTTGAIQTLGADRGYGKPSRLDILYQFMENKENPIIALGTKALRGTDPIGNPLNLPAEAGKTLIPLTAQSVYSTAKDTGSVLKAVGMNIPGTFGVGVQTYGSSPVKPSSTKTSSTKTTTKLTPPQQYQANLTKYQDAKKAGTLTAAKDYSTQQSLAKEAITSKYSQAVLDFYGLSKTAQTAMLAQDKAGTTDLYNQAKQMDAALTAAGGTSKYKTALGTTKTTKTTKAKTTKAKSSGSKVAKAKFVTTGFKTASLSKIPKITGVKVKKLAYKPVKTRKLSISKMPRIA